ncbi:MAG: hypothetical protein AAF623_21290 [Planctomycetota bacterium]
MTDRQIQLIVFVTSRRWESIIRRNFPDADIHWVLNLEEAWNLSRRIVGGSILIEVNESRIDEAERLSTQLVNNPQQWLTFAINEMTGLNKNQLDHFDGICQDVFQLDRLIASVRKHQDSYRCERNETIEDRIWRSLPWRPAVKFL